MAANVAMWGIFAFLVGVAVHESGHAVARSWLGLRFCIALGRGPCLLKSKYFVLRLLPVSARTKGDKPISVVVPLAGPVFQLAFALCLLPWSPWIALLGGLGALTILPYRVYGQASDGLLALQIVLKGA
ncbi:hypothetical protein [Alicyclobacillus sp. SO9]|uniref:hypothetical protein n=1 Tax=Alicyclobacillus sp. SO9 TaxID=2665646 RepID=UPI0018E75575|nr:hypothetical protein [Alicyclobacillus sp. SO9]QQE79699.1 hypothetical protein GI364_04205 [Alicyclobacillus sp. SO9]